MKKIIILELIMVPLFAIALFMPNMMEKMITEVEVTSLTKENYSEDIYINGCIEANNEKDIIAEIPIVPEKIYYSVGDKVEANSVIADIDVPATQAALFNIAQTVSAIPQEYIDVVKNFNIDEDIIKSYIPTQITAPTDGVITSMDLTEGVIATPKSTALTISKIDKLRVKVSVNELQADKVKFGDKVVFKASATGEEKYLGRIERIFPTATKTIVGTTQSTVVSMYVTMDNKYERLKPGYTVNGVIKQPVNKTVNVLPYESVLQDENNQEYVYLVFENKLQRCNVKTGNDMKTGVEIISPDLVSQKVVKNASQIKKPDNFVRIVSN